MGFFRAYAASALGHADWLASRAHSASRARSIIWPCRPHRPVAALPPIDELGAPPTAATIIAMSTKIELFQAEIMAGIPAELPAPRPLNPNFPHPKGRKHDLDAAGKRLALRNA